jgi:hypothetical protein
MISHIEGFGTMAAVNSTADTPAEPIPSGKFMKNFLQKCALSGIFNFNIMNVC